MKIMQEDINREPVDQFYIYDENLIKIGTKAFS